MPNLIARLTDVKAALDITGTEEDDELLRLSGSVSRAFERLCGRVFYWTPAATRYVTVRDAESGRLKLPFDLLSLTSLAVDSAAAGTYATTLVLNTDFWSEPDDGTTPITALSLFPWGATYAAWPMGTRVVRIVGDTGYSRDTLAAGTVGTGGINSSATTLPLASGHDVSAGDTIVIGTEHLYVSEVVENTATVQRGVNGTTAAAHDAAAAITRVVHPADLVQAAILMIGSLYHGQRTGGSGSVGDAAIGFAFDQLPDQVQLLISPFRRGSYVLAVG